MPPTPSLPASPDLLERHVDIVAFAGALLYTALVVTVPALEALATTVCSPAVSGAFAVLAAGRWYRKMTGRPDAAAT